MIDLSGVVLAFADTSLTITRSVATWGTDGRPSTTSSTVGPVRALVTPRRERRSPELQGEVGYGSADVYAATPLLRGDTFTTAGKTYVVDTVAGYESTGNFCVAVARQVPAP